MIVRFSLIFFHFTSLSRLSFKTGVVYDAKTYEGGFQRSNRMGFGEILETFPKYDHIVYGRNTRDHTGEWIECTTR